MRLKNSFEFVSVGDEMTAIPIGDSSFHGVILLNETMKDVLEIMETGCFTIDSIADVMESRYADISKDELYNTIQGICMDLIEKGIIEK